MLSVIRSIQRQVDPLALAAYNKAMSTEQLLPLIAQVSSRPDLVGENIITLEWVAAFPQLRKWVGERQTQNAFSGSLSGKPANYEITYDQDRGTLASGRALAEIAELSPKIMEEFVEGRWDLAYAVLRDNPLAPIDGQNFFDTDHTHPDGTTYSNLITPTRVSAAAPTDAEIRSEFRTAKRRLLTNRVIRQRVRDVRSAENNLIAIAHSDAVEAALENLLTEEEIGGVRNIYRGTFRLLRDPSPASGEENSWELVWAEPNGPRPTIFVAIREPQGIEFDEHQMFMRQYVAFGAYSKYLVLPAFPQTAVRSKP